MAAGLPVASTNVGDVAEMVSEPNAPFITNKADADELGQALGTLAADLTAAQVSWRCQPGEGAGRIRPESHDRHLSAAL